MNQKILNTIVEWAQHEEAIRTLLLIGSFARKKKTDELSDYDIALFTNDVKKYETDDAWIHTLWDVIVYEPCELHRNNKIYQTRLIIYSSPNASNLPLQVDFTLYDLEYLQFLEEQKTLPVDFNLGYEVLLDKDGLTKNLQSPTYEYPYTKKPTQKEFELAIRIFFFEVFKEAKALVRNDLWHAKVRDWTTKEYLLCMIEWHEKTKHGWNYDTNCDAKSMQSWVDKIIWNEAHNIFAPFDAQHSWKALFANICTK